MTENKITKQLTIKDFESALGEKLSKFIKDSINSYEFKYKELSQKQNDELILLIIKTLIEKNPVKTRGSRISDWENGWGENLNLLQTKEIEIKNLIPKYFSKYNVIRFNGRFIQPISERFEKNTLSILVDYIFDKFLRNNVPNIYEFGCGTAHNLLQARKVNKNANLWGLDWAKSSQKIIELIRKKGIDKKIYSHNFNYFEPDLNFKLNNNSVIYSVASLEQVGDRWDNFIDYLLVQKPQLCIHIEPVEELLDRNNLLDYLSIQYFNKRNYLSGFLFGLKKLEKQKKIKILKADRNKIGSLFIEGYSIIVWHPI